MYGRFEHLLMYTKRVLAVKQKTWWFQLTKTIARVNQVNGVTTPVRTLELGPGIKLNEESSVTSLMLFICRTTVKDNGQLAQCVTPSYLNTRQLRLAPVVTLGGKMPSESLC